MSILELRYNKEAKKVCTPEDFFQTSIVQARLSSVRRAMATLCYEEIMRVGRIFDRTFLNHVLGEG